MSFPPSRAYASMFLPHGIVSTNVLLFIFVSKTNVFVVDVRRDPLLHLRLFILLFHLRSNLQIPPKIPRLPNPQRNHSNNVLSPSNGRPHRPMVLSRSPRIRETLSVSRGIWMVVYGLSIPVVFGVYGLLDLLDSSWIASSACV